LVFVVGFYWEIVGMCDNTLANIVKCGI